MTTLVRCQISSFKQEKRKDTPQPSRTKRVSPEVTRIVHTARAQVLTSLSSREQNTMYEYTNSWKNASEDKDAH